MSEWVDYEQLSKTLGITEEEARKFVSEGKTTPQSTPFLSANNITLYQSDFITTQTVADSSVDLIVTSPPYNVGIEYSTHDDTDDYGAYLHFTRQWLQKAYSMSKPDGRLCLNIPLDKNKGGQQSVCADITHLAKTIGWQYHSTIIWNEGNISRRTAWGSWLSASAPYVIAPVEVIVVLYKDTWKKQKRATPPQNNITKEEFMAWTNGVWAFNGESKKRIGHPAPFPRELPKRCIKLFSYVGDTVLDPFAGSGTTLLEAWHNQRAGIGFEIAEEYCLLTQKRLEDTWRQTKLI